MRDGLVRVATVKSQVSGVTLELTALSILMIDISVTN